MSQEQTVTVTLEQVKFSMKDIAELDNLVKLLPYYQAKPIYDWLNGKMTEQLEAKAKEVQAEMQAKAQGQLKLALDEVPETTTRPD